MRHIFILTLTMLSMCFALIPASGQFKLKIRPDSAWLPAGGGQTFFGGSITNDSDTETLYITSASVRSDPEGVFYEGGTLFDEISGGLVLMPGETRIYPDIGTENDLRGGFFKIIESGAEAGIEFTLDVFGGTSEIAEDLIGSESFFVERHMLDFQIVPDTLSSPMDGGLIPVTGYVYNDHPYMDVGVETMLLSGGGEMVAGENSLLALLQEESEEPRPFSFLRESRLHFTETFPLFYLSVDKNQPSFAGTVTLLGGLRPDNLIGTASFHFAAVPEPGVMALVLGSLPVGIFCYRKLRSIKRRVSR